MRTAARKKTRRRAKPPSESAVYDGARFCGTITPKAGEFVARLATGKSLGKFANERLAQRALTGAMRATRAPQAQHGDVADGFARRPGELPREDGANSRAQKRAPQTAISGTTP